MDVQRLIKFANNIGAFFDAEPDKAKAAQGVATHIRNFWEPRMRRQILEYVDTEAGKGLNPIVLAALQEHRKELTPPKL
jgi:formate dehydrogenase subunit delta